MAAETGDTAAQYNIALMHANGEGVPQDDAEAARWWRLAAEQGGAKGQLGLGLMYAAGEGVPQDYIQAHMWLNLAASSATDPELRDDAIEDREEVAAKMTSEQIGKA